jgi:ADP-ribose pyrophosphatase
MTDDDPITRVQENLVFENAYIAVYDDAVTMPGGRPGSYLRIVESQGRPGVAVLPLCADLVGLVKTFRYPAGEWEWAIPRGFAHDADPVVSARNEAKEELGGEPDRLVELGVVRPNSGLMSSRAHLFIGFYDEPTTAPLDVDEVHELRWLPLARLIGWVRDGEVTDGFTLSALSQAAIKGHLTFPR